MKKIIIFLIVFTTLFIVKDAASQQITYSGPVEYKQIKTIIAKGSGSKGYNWNVDIDEKYIIEGTFYVTFTGGVSPTGVSMFQLTSIEEDIHFEITVNNEVNEEMIFQRCYDDKMVFKQRVYPGDSRTDKLAVNSIRLDPEKPCITGGYLVVTKGEYSIMLIGEIKADVTSIKYESRTFPCLDSNPPPHSLTDTSKMDIPIVVFAEKVFDGSNILEGRSVVTDIHNTDCKRCLGSLATMAHGDVDCAYDENITVSWTLVKRSKECDAKLSYAKGDVKINGVSVKEGNIKISAGDMISTGDKSRMKIIMPGNQMIMLGSKSRLIVKDPCNLAPREMKDPHYSGYKLLKGKLFQAIKGDCPDFEVRVRTTVIGVRGQISPAAGEYYVSNDNNIKVSSGPYFDQQYVTEIDPEKESMINEFTDLKDYKNAFYVHTEPEAIYDVSAIKGDILVESAIGSDKMVVKEGSTVTSWPDGSPFLDIYIGAK